MQVIFRIQELTGKEFRLARSLPVKKIIKSVWETDGQERRIKEIPLQKGKFIFELDPYAIRSFAVITEMAADSVQTITDFQVPLQFDDDVVSYSPEPRKRHIREYRGRNTRRTIPRQPFG